MYIYLFYLFILQAISNGKHSFKQLCWNVNENCDVDIAIDRASYQSKKQQEKKTTLQVFAVLFTRPASPSVIYGTLLLPLMLLRTTAKKKHCSRVFTFLRVELRALLRSGPPSRVRKGRSCEVKILICAYNVR